MLPPPPHLFPHTWFVSFTTNTFTCTCGLCNKGDFLSCTINSKTNCLLWQCYLYMHIEFCTGLKVWTTATAIDTCITWRRLRKTFWRQHEKNRGRHTIIPRLRVHKKGRRASVLLYNNIGVCKRTYWSTEVNINLAVQCTQNALCIHNRYSHIM